jgi:putative colanic acid polymerase
MIAPASAVQSTRHGLSVAVSALTFVLVAFQHFQVASLGGFPLTVGAIAGLTLLATVFRRPGDAIIPVLTTLVVVSSLNALNHAKLVSAGEEYWRTLALVVLAAVIICVSLGPMRDRDVIAPAVARGAFAALVVVVVIAVGQVVLGAMGNTALFNLFGPFQYLYKYDPLLEFNPIPRAQGLYLEPSYLAFITGGLAVLLSILKYRPTAVILLGLVGLVCARSATGLIIAILIIGVAILRSRSKLRGIVLVLVIPAFVALWPYLDSRITSIASEGSSAYYRLVGPTEVLSDVLTRSPFGMPLGSVEAVMPSYALLNGAEVGASLDNGIYLIVFYYGWLGVLMVSAMLVWVVGALMKGRSGANMWMASAWMLGSLFFSGGIFLPEFALMSALIVTSLRLEKS